MTTSTAEFQFKSIDTEGMATLEAIADAPNFNRWMYEVTSKHLSGHILEIGSGIGNISEQYLLENRQITVSDIRENYCEHLKKRFAGNPNLKGVLHLDLVHPRFEQEYAHLLGSFDAAFALNVVEHIESDGLALQNAYKLLKSGGRLVILVPAYQSLYNHFDKALEHFRRYTTSHLSTLFEKANFQVTHRQYFNLAAIAGWWFSGTLLKKEVIPNGQMKIYNALVPIFRILDKIVSNRIGISVIVEGIKK